MISLKSLGNSENARAVDVIHLVSVAEGGMDDGIS